ncbi:Disulphide bond corrector protein DsbC [Marinobacter segnicrescens]|uniref:Disulphide bond corrector protein DsbC n=1 Tax=Marinobacter segnicrescens TaxID=430453 RepID=A0A1I0HMR3_9GAMM|nr:MULTISPECIES: protein-disulfide reductase DsbD domain-containing protein [Marinobacter]UZD66361.1 protein-disulfide reductase DsbD N-terminal domain-containing protein [Marinobacter sp. AN1]SET85193.1 Disulphide bond corrector protein DsbC [Marinobacter segnicrescens]
MTTLAKVLLTGIAVFLIAIAAFMLIGTNSGKAPGSAQPEQASSDPQAPVARTGLADSSDKVRLNLAEGGKALIGETGEIVLTLDIEPGWHVNANPASMEFLIPTVAKSSAGGQSLDIPTEYPRGRVSDIVLGDTALEVYDDGASIRLLPDEKQTTALKEAGKLDMTVRVQACSDEGVCLAPADLPVSLNLDDTKPQ